MRKHIVISLLAAMLGITSALAQEVTFKHPWAGKRVALFGDSITDPGLGKGGGFTMYWAYLQEWLNLDIYNYAVSGRQWNDIPRQLHALQAEHGNDVDAILIMMGTNDYNMGIPVGEWFTEKEEYVLAGTDMDEPAIMQLRKRRYPVMDDATVKGRINIALKLIKETYPQCPVVLLTPLHRGWFRLDEGNVQPEESYQNRIGEYLDAYVNAVKEAANIWSVNVIDLHAVSNMNPLAGQEGYYKADWDHLHPGKEGNLHLAQVLYYQLLTIAVNGMLADDKPLVLKELSHNTITDAVGSGQYSGITHLGGNHFAVVHDKLGSGGLLFFLIRLREDGTVEYASKTVPEGTAGSDRRDNEGVAYVPSTRTLFISAEADQSIREYDLQGRPTGRQLAVPDDMGLSHITRNKGFEALTYNAKTHLFWTTTEGPLLEDEDLLLRLQSFGEDLNPATRYTYRMDAPAVSAQKKADASAYVHGVPALAALDDGSLIVLEREVYVPGGGIKGKLDDSFTTTKLFLVKPGSDKDGVLQKRLLTCFDTSALSNFANYEGMCTGPRLPDGRQTLLLIPDSQDGSSGLTQEYIKVFAIE
jgi:lysophospholipase L1-like esterase